MKKSVKLNWRYKRCYYQLFVNFMVQYIINKLKIYYK